MENESHIANSVLDALDEVLSLVGGHRSCHILEADSVKAHSLELLAHLYVLVNCMHRALCV